MFPEVMVAGAKCGNFSTENKKAIALNELEGRRELGKICKNYATVLYIATGNGLNQREFSYGIPILEQEKLYQA